MNYVKAGDILLYGHVSGFETRLVELGEILEDGKQDHEYYHVAIAVDDLHKVESDVKSVAINPIVFGGFDVFRPPIDQASIYKALKETCELVGEPYDWALVIDDTLRYLTHNFIHLPVKWINSQERRKKICSSLVAFYFKQAGWTSKNNSSPEDIYLMVKDWPIREGD